VSFIQGVLPFNDIPDPIVVTPEQGKQIVAERAKGYGLLGPRKSIKLARIGLRPEQFVVFEEILPTDGNMLIEIDPGAGKTFLFGGETVSEVNKPEPNRTLFVTNGHRLIDQCLKMFGEFTDFREDEVLCVSGENSDPKKRRAGYEKMPSAIAITARALKNDLINELFIWDGIRVVYCDEPQKYWRGKDAGAVLFRKFIQKGDVVLRVMSGTLVRNDPGFLVLRHETNAQKVITVANKFETIADDVIRVKHENPVTVDETFTPVDMDAQLKKLVHAICEAALSCQKQIEKLLQEPVLIEKPDPIFMRVASDPERAEVLKKILSLKETNPNKGRLLKLWAKWGKLAARHQQTVLMGRYPFMEYYCYNWAKRRIHPGLFLPELENEPDIEKRGDLSSADNEILGDEGIHAVMLEMTEKDPFGLLLRNDNWADVLRHTKRMFTPFDRKGRRRTRVAERRSKRMQALNRQLPDDWKSKVVMARYFFHRCISFFAARELDDHPKVQILIDQLDDIKEVIQRSRGYVFDWTQRHVELLAEILEVRCSKNMGLRPVSLYGGDGPGMKAWKKNAFDGFDGDEYNLLVATTGIAGTGLDAADARVAAFYTLQNTDPDLWQYLGRVLGRTPDVAYIRVLYTRDTIEEGRYHRALNKHYSRRRAVRSRAKILIPEFIVKKED